MYFLHLNVPFICCNAMTVLPGVSHQSLPWTCVWYTTKYSSFPQLSNSSPWQRWRHMSSFSNSWREKRGVGKPQWHRSPARTASDFSWNTDAISHTADTLTCTNVQCMNKHIVSPSPCTCPHTCPQTCFGWRRWREGPEWHCLAGGNSLWKWRCHLKHTKPKRYTATEEMTHNRLQFYGYWAQLPSDWPLFTDPWWRDPTGILPRVYWGSDLPADSTNSSTDIPAVCWWPLTSGPHSGLMDRTQRTAASFFHRELLVYL